MTHDPIPEGRRTCWICGHAGLKAEVQPGLARLVTPGPNGPFTEFDRCRDHVACRVRCEADGDPWPLADATPHHDTTPEERPDAA